MIASYSIRSRIDKEMKWNTGPQFNTEASYFSIPTELFEATQRSLSGEAWWLASPLRQATTLTLASLPSGHAAWSKVAGTSGVTRHGTWTSFLGLVCSVRLSFITLKSSGWLCSTSMRSSSLSSSSSVLAYSSSSIDLLCLAQRMGCGMRLAVYSSR